MTKESLKPEIETRLANVRAVLDQIEEAINTAGSGDDILALVSVLNAADIAGLLTLFGAFYASD